MKELHGFELIKEVVVTEINSTVNLYKHKKSGAEVMSITNDDENKVFGVTFRTPPSDSTGLPHIMEHSVLCGSRKYPVKEPFVELVKGSLNTFLNAFTYPDKTCYPVASTNLQDFYNLVDVYLDAVFYPLITPQTLMQEGWHYELNNIDDELTFKGVVYNEMKGAYSSPDDILGDESQMQLLPNTPYGFQSGGDPECIPDLTYEQFKQFHQTFYHPGNSRIYFYGDDDPEVRLKLLDEYLKDFDQILIDSLPNLQEKFNQPFEKTIPYDSGEDNENGKAFLTVNWLLPEGNNPELVLSLGILEHILLGTPASPLRKILIESGFGEDVVGRGLMEEMRQMGFSTGMRGIEPNNIHKVSELIISSLMKIAQEGIDAKTIEASLNTIEFNLRENNTGPYPRGLIVMLRTLSAWIYDRDPIAPLAFQKSFDSIKTSVNNGSFKFVELIEKYLVENQHRVTVILTPDSSIGVQRIEKEKNRLKESHSAFSKEQMEKILQETEDLKRRQETPDTPEALATIPMLKKEDLDPKIKELPNQVIQTIPSTILFHDLFTSGILYLDLGFNLKALTAKHLPYMRLFMRALLEMGTEKESFVELIQRIGRETGGIYHSLFTSQLANQKGLAAYLFLRAKVMTDKTSSLLSLLEDIFLIPNFKDKERLRQILMEEKSSMEAGIIPSGHRVVNNRLKAQYSQSAWMTEQMSGIDYLFFIRDLISQFDQNWNSIVSIFEEIKTLLITQNNLIVNATIDQKNWDALEPGIKSFIETLPLFENDLQSWTSIHKNINEGLIIPSQVNFVGKGGNLFDLGYKEHGSINVITQYLRSTWLWDKVRVQGGAYGGFCAFDRFTGIFTYLSYRDPNLLSTLENYDLTGKFLKNFELSESEITKSIIGAIGELDAYQLPDAKGFSAMVRFLLEITDEDRQKFRDELLATSFLDFRNFALILEKLNNQASIVVLGSQEAIDKTRQDHNLFSEIRRIL
ncbi:MAG: insulinase family protein [Anaerolineaceae bacterium]|nr:insulinase family protein [Anaerolineaceae bacterium]